VKSEVARMWAKTTNRFSVAGEVRKTGFRKQGAEKTGFKLKLSIRHAQAGGG